MTAIILLPASVVAKLAPVDFAQTANQQAPLTSLANAVQIMALWKRLALAMSHAAIGAWCHSHHS